MPFANDFQELMFQSAPSRGGRSSSRIVISRAFLVSIRALAWRAIQQPPNRLFDPFQFQSAPSRGGRFGLRRLASDAGMFQSAPSRGGRCHSMKVLSAS